MQEKKMGPGLAAALVRAQRQVRGSEKDGTNQFHKYKYASAESMLKEGRECLNVEGLALFVTDSAVIVRDIRTVRPVEGGSVDTLLSATWQVVDYLLVHESGESYAITTETAICPEKGRPQDKAEAAALTGNLSYTLRGLLLIPRVEEGTLIDQRDDTKHDPGKLPPSTAAWAQKKHDAGTATGAKPVAPPSPAQAAPTEEAEETAEELVAKAVFLAAVTAARGALDVHMLAKAYGAVRALQDAGKVSLAFRDRAYAKKAAVQAEIAAAIEAARGAA